MPVIDNMPRRSARSGSKQFRDRREAGRLLAEAVARQRFDMPVVLALPRGGVPVAAEIAERLDAPLDVLVVRKLGCPGRPEFGIGAIAEGDIRVLNEPAIARLGISAEQIDAVAASETAELTRRLGRYRGRRPAVSVRGRTAIVVDDGLATGFTARAALEVVRRKEPQRLVLAVPVGSADTVAELHGFADQVVCLRAPVRFMAIGQWYADFRQVTDAEVTGLLERRAAAGTSATVDPSTDVVTDEVRIPAGTTTLPGTLSIPRDPVGAVIFAHGSGSSRMSPRNVAVARELNGGALATLLFDLLDPAEATDRANVFDIALLAERLQHATRWLQRLPAARGLPIAYFGASTGAAAALRAAASIGRDVAAVVSRGGRPDLAAGHLHAVTAPTLLIVGGRDTPVIRLNERARQQLRCENSLEIVPGATHLFSEPGAMERVSELARDWFSSHLPTSGGPSR